MRGRIHRYGSRLVLLAFVGAGCAVISGCSLIKIPSKYDVAVNTSGTVRVESNNALRVDPLKVDPLKIDGTVGPNPALASALGRLTAPGAPAPAGPVPPGALPLPPPIPDAVLPAGR